MNKDLLLTQQFSSWGDKLLQHCDVLHQAQAQRTWRPITVQLAPTELCDSDCPFCSVQNRPTAVMAWPTLVKCLEDFRALGAKSVEITGGGNPMLYRHSDHDINDIIKAAHALGFDVGVITNSAKLTRLTPDVYDKITWLRVSLIQLDEGVPPESYDFHGFPMEKLGFSYIVYAGTTTGSVDRIFKLVELHPGIKFVRVAGDCLIKGNNAEVFDQWRSAFNDRDSGGKVFFKAIGHDDDAYPDGCYVGMTRPYVAAHPQGKGHYVYICNSHVLNKRNYDLDYALCRVDDVADVWPSLNAANREQGYPYQVRGNKGCGWDKTCNYCYYKNNNRLLHTVTHDMPDKNFP